MQSWVLNNDRPLPSSRIACRAGVCVIVEGTWSLINFSGALPQDQINAILRRVDKLLKAVVIAREEANSAAIAEQKIAEPIFNYLFDL